VYGVGQKKGKNQKRVHGWQKKRADWERAISRGGGEFISHRKQCAHNPVKKADTTIAGVGMSEVVGQKKMGKTKDESVLVSRGTFLGEEGILHLRRATEVFYGQELSMRISKKRRPSRIFGLSGSCNKAGDRASAKGNTSKRQSRAKGRRQRLLDHGRLRQAIKKD